MKQYVNGNYNYLLKQISYNFIWIIPEFFTLTSFHPEKESLALKKVISVVKTLFHTFIGNKLELLLTYV